MICHCIPKREAHVFSSVARFMSDWKSWLRYTYIRLTSSSSTTSGIATPVINASKLSSNGKPPCGITDTFNIQREPVKYLYQFSIVCI